MSDFPSGTVTFLFTDIEGSTALWERDSAAMAAAVARHLALLDAASAAQGGAVAVFDSDYASLAFAYPDSELAERVERTL